VTAAASPELAAAVTNVIEYHARPANKIDPEP
jgi:hypothetical protein